MSRAKKTPDMPKDRLDEMLERLKLGAIRDQLDSLLDEAGRSNLSARETLIMLCERKIARKDHRRIDMALKLAHFPAVKELSGFDFEAQRRETMRTARHLQGFTNVRFIAKNGGPSGEAAEEGTRRNEP